MNLIAKIRAWYRENHSHAWVDKDSEWHEYRLNWQKEHAVSVTIEKCKLQIHPDTGEHRTDRTPVATLKKHYDCFDDKGYFLYDDELTIAPKTEDDEVIGIHESDVKTVEFKITPSDVESPDKVET